MMYRKIGGRLLVIYQYLEQLLLYFLTTMDSYILQVIEGQVGQELYCREKLTTKQIQQFYKTIRKLVVSFLRGYI